LFAWTNFGSFDTGGGFSNYATTQSSAVQSYLSSGVQLPPTSTYKAQGRGNPDVAAIESNTAVIIRGV